MTLRFILTGEEEGGAISRDNQSFNTFFQIYDQCVQVDPKKRPTAQDVLTLLTQK
jgi:hypothetical protein